MTWGAENLFFIEDDRLYRNVPLQRHLIELLDSNPGGITINVRVACNAAPHI